MGYSRKIQTGGWGYTFCISPRNFSCVFFIPRNSRQKVQSLDIPQNCVRSLGNSKAKKKRPLDIPHYFSLVTLGNSTSLVSRPPDCWTVQKSLLLEQKLQKSLEIPIFQFPSRFKIQVDSFLIFTVLKNWWKYMAKTAEVYKPLFLLSKNSSN